jgi:hypothetical protein
MQLGPIDEMLNFFPRDSKFPQLARCDLNDVPIAQRNGDRYAHELKGMGIALSSATNVIERIGDGIR